MRTFPWLLFALLLGCHPTAPSPSPEAPVLPKVAAGELRPAAAFAAIADPRDRSKALFLEASRVLTHPRCTNCHPDGDSPLQGMNGRVHDPPVTRGPEDQGVVAMNCTSCHQEQNAKLARVPGAPKWHLAPRMLAWVGKSPRQICEQMKDPKRNGGKDLTAIIEHNTHDELVGWGWHPGADREPVPGTQAQFGALIAEWVNTGAECPNEESRP